MRYLSICSGIEAASAAWMPLGWRPVAFSEIEPFPCAVLAHHYPDVPNLGDMSLFRDWPDELFADADAIVGGPPCQAFSVAGARRGLLDARGNLTLIYVELLDHADDIRRKYGKPPIVALYENVPGIFSDRTNAFGCLVGGLAGEDVPVVPPGKRWTDAGCVFGPERAVAWRLFDAQFFGLAQRRRRVFVVASARKGFDPATVLFEWDGVRRDTAPSREARQTAPTIPARSTAGGGLGTDFDCDGGLQVAGTMKACKDSGGWSNSADHAAAGYMVPVRTFCVSTGQAGAEIGADMTPTLNCNHEAPYVAHSLRGEGFDASEDGTGRGKPLIPAIVGQAMSRKWAKGSAGPAGDEHHNLIPVPFDTTQITSAANYSSPRPGDPCHPLAASAHAPAIAFPAGLSGTQYVSSVEVAPSLGAANTTAVATQWAVRRLTPEECEALQGFPRGYTTIPWRGKPADQCPDGPRYKSLGNSWAVPVARWIGERIEAVEAILGAQPNQQERRAA